jgi:hypothetical protein
MGDIAGIVFVFACFMWAAMMRKLLWFRER